MRGVLCACWGRRGIALHAGPGSGWKSGIKGRPLGCAGIGKNQWMYSWRSESVGRMESLWLRLCKKLVRLLGRRKE
ncbi:hypothetical protein FGO68_gene9437 [Halteria grandinella]|uniref:Uncharacterized protein n=1 Tax=Halteria grandinella TaxID=5974 RepID=A0A8J8SWP7_HALGN|nr:hypothetical protein FGO68_gene9437 [Halteria grandinella]